MNDNNPDFNMNDIPTEPFQSAADRLFVILGYTMTSGYEKMEVIPAAEAEHLFGGLDSRQWNELYELAALQGVLAVVYDVVYKLPTSLMPGRELNLKWALNTEVIAVRSDRQARALSHLSEIFARGDIRIMIFKGFSLSRYYPVPRYRECGDVDLYLMGDYDKGNKVIEGLGIEIDSADPKHASFMLDGVLMENHSAFVNISNYSTANDRVLNQHLVEETRNAIDTGEGFLIPSPMFNALYLLRHSAKHFGMAELSIRHILDWGLLLKNEIGKIDTGKYKRIIREVGLQNSSDIFTSIAADMVGEDFSRIMFAAPDDELKNKVRETIFAGDARIRQKKYCICQRTKRLLDRKWRYDKVLPERFWSDIIATSLSINLRKATKHS